MGRKTKVRIGDLVEVRWHDAHHDTAYWHDGSDIEPAVIVSVGYFVDRANDLLAVAQSVGVEDGSAGGVFRIPLGCVLGVSVLRSNAEREERDGRSG